VYVVYRGLAEVTTRLEHDPNAALAATTGTFSGAFTSPGIDDNATSTAMTLDASGNLLVGTTDSTPWTNSANSTADNGFVVSSYGTTGIARYQAEALNLNRTGNDGSILDFQRSGTTVGSIGVAGGDLFISGGTSHAGLRFDTNILTPVVNTTQTDATVDLGYSSQRFRDLHLSGGVFLGGSGSANYLNDYEEGTWTPQLWKGPTQVTSPTAVYGLYRKVGSVFLVSFYFYKSSGSNTDNGGWEIRGFPFAIVSSSTAAYMSLAAGYTAINGANVFNQTGSHRWQANGTTYLSLYGPQYNTQWTSGHVEFAASGFLVTS
jgi:hypothetical protein